VTAHARGGQDGPAGVKLDRLLPPHRPMELYRFVHRQDEHTPLRVTATASAHQIVGGGAMLSIAATPLP
jgi:hypothetical protein